MEIVILGKKRGRAKEASRFREKRGVIRTKGIRGAINHLATYSLQGPTLRETNMIALSLSLSSKIQSFRRQSAVTRAGLRGRDRNRIQREVGKKR